MFKNFKENKQLWETKFLLAFCATSSLICIQLLDVMQ